VIPFDQESFTALTDIPLGFLWLLNTSGVSRVSSASFFHRGQFTGDISLLCTVRQLRALGLFRSQLIVIRLIEFG